MAEDLFNIESYVPPAEDQVIDVEEAANELSALIQTACNFLDEQFMPDWETAQKYYDGLTDLPTITGRSKVVSTAVRDAIRSARPSLLRVFLQADTIVEYIPDGVRPAELAAQQSKFVNSLFFRSNGYRALYDCMQNAMLKKLGVMKFWFDDSTEVKYIDLTGIPADEIERVMARPDAQVMSMQPSETQPVIISPDGTPIQLFDAKLAVFTQNGKICVESVPLEEFSSTKTPLASTTFALSATAAKCGSETPSQWACRSIFWTVWTLWTPNFTLEQANLSTVAAM